MLIEKTDGKGNKTIIESETYDVELIDKPSAEQIQALVSVLTNEQMSTLGSHSNSNTSMSGSGAMSWLLPSIIPPVGKCINTGGMYLVDSKLDILEGSIYPNDPSDNSRGIVGYVAIDWTTYVGDSKVYGTMNLSESNKLLENRRQRHHIVIDFPTHACNGSIDTIYISPYAYGEIPQTDRNIGGNIKCISHIPTVKNVIGDVGNVTVYTSQSFTDWARSYIHIYEDGVILIVGDTKVSIFKNGKFATLNRIFTINSRVYNALMKDGKYYMYECQGNDSNLTSIQLVEITIVEVDGVLTATYGDMTNLGSLFTIAHFPKARKYNIRNFGTFENVNYSVYSDAYNIFNATEKTYITFYDKTWNVIKTDEITSDNDNSICVLYDDVNNKKISIYGNVYDKQLKLLGVTTLRPSKKGTGVIRTNGIKNYMFIRENMGIHYGTNAATSGNGILVEVDTKNQAPIEIKLKEPLNKNNAETLKLIFDFDLSMT